MIAHTILEEFGITFGIADGQCLLLDSYLPRAQDGQRPAVVLIHGGGMWTGSRADMREPARALALAGFAAFAIDYRLVNAAFGRNRWPAQVDDAQAAVRWVRAHAADFDIDLDCIAADGWSAGGQLAALLGTRQTRLDEVVALLGGTLAEAPAQYRDASPLTWIDAETVPFLIVLGLQDDVVPIDQSRRLAKALRAAGVPMRYVELPGIRHHDLSWERVGPEVISFLDQMKPQLDAES